MYRAHSLNDKPEADWQPLDDHLEAVASLASARAQKFGCGHAAYLAGQLHDLGKYTAAFQKRLRGDPSKVDHATAGARMTIELAAALPETRRRSAERIIADVVAHAIAGHHAGLPDSLGSAGALDDRLTRTLEPLDPVWLAEIRPELRDLWPDGLDFGDIHGDRNGMARALGFLGRMIFSTLVDADFRDTEAFYAKAEGRQVDRNWPVLPQIVDQLVCRFDSFMAQKQGAALASPVNTLRAAVLDHVRAGSDRPPGLFTLNVPTGGGKTLASLGFALDHARRHGLDRIVYVIPFTSVIDQTAAIFREVLGHDVVLEHHASIDEERFGGRSSRDKLRLAMEDWAAPIVVTTNVQLFESLYSHKPSRCRRLHNLSRAVIVLDEAQTIPLPVLRPCVAAIKELATRYGSTAVLCTATMPALDRADFPGGLELGPERELAPDPAALHGALRRVRLERVGELNDDDLIEAMAKSGQSLAIVNSRRHALALYRTGSAAGLEGIVHLSTRQCAADRRVILEKIRADLRAGLPCRLIATSLVEAGVDIDFPKVWRAEAGLDQIAQAAGRCNREGIRPVEDSIVTVFKATDHKPPSEIAGFVADFERIAPGQSDLFAPAAMRAYFSEVYWRRGAQALDKHKVLDGFRMTEDRNRRSEPDFEYRRIGESFRLIESDMLPVIIGSHPEAKSIMAALKSGAMPPGAAARKLQGFVVQLPPRDRASLFAAGHVTFAREAEFEHQFAELASPDLYSATVGLDWEAADNLVYSDFIS